MELKQEFFEITGILHYTYRCISLFFLVFGGPATRTVALESVARALSWGLFFTLLQIQIHI